MINGDAGVKNGIFIPAREKIRWSNGIREKRKKDPYKVCQERRLVILECRRFAKGHGGLLTYEGGLPGGGLPEGGLPEGGLPGGGLPGGGLPK
ncbi:hypothetical protein Tco_0966043 [Tanacetum coccineum]